MVFRYGDRHQQTFLPTCVDDYIESDAPVRAYDAFVDALNFSELGIRIDRLKVGSPQYHPVAMLKLLIYGYSYGIRSSRKLERECHYNLSFIWMMGGLKPDHKTIAEFRRNNKKALKKAMTQCAQLCIEIGLIEGNVLFVDGTPMRADASISNSWTEKRGKRVLKAIKINIDKLLGECETTDQEEQGDGSLTQLKDKLLPLEAFKEKVELILKTLEETGVSSVNTVDADALRQIGRQGSHAGFSLQGVVDNQHGLLVHMDVVSANNDLGQLAHQADQALEVLSIIERTPDSYVTFCIDAGYAKYYDLQKVESEKVQVVIPSQKQASGTAAGPFDKEKFEYDQKKDVLICPEGKVLSRISGDTQDGRVIYRTDKDVCQGCRHYMTCTKSARGRQVERYPYETFKKTLEVRYETDDAQEIYRHRKERSEPVFGHIKRNLGAGHFLLRGLPGVQAEASLLGCVYNVRRMITLLGVKGFIEKVA